MGSLNQFWADFTSKYWLVIAIKTDGIKTVNRNPPGHLYSDLISNNIMPSSPGQGFPVDLGH